MRLAVLFLSLVLLADISFAQEKPGLLVTPTRVVLEGKNRSASISLVNNGNVAGTYRIGVVNRRMNDDGTIVRAEKAEGDEKFADTMLRISPRQITLQPGEHQNVRILARKPKDLEPGEYRSHLNFSILPEDELTDHEKKKRDTQDESLTISIKANFGVTIPVIVRHGDISVSASISGLKLGKDKDGHPNVSFSVVRKGEESLYGNIMVSYKNPEGKEYVLKSLGGLAVYTPNKKRDFKVRLDVPDGVIIKGGVIDVTYKEKATDGGNMLASAELKL